MKKIFPFAPGLVWKVNNNIVYPVENKNIFNYISNKKIIIASFGGLLETFFSIYFKNVFENYSDNIYFSFNNEFNDFYRIFNLNKFDFDKKYLKKFPLPIFFSKNDYVIINPIYNYIKMFDLNGDFVRKLKYPCFKQIFKNSLTKWDNEYKLNFNFDKNKINIINFTSPYFIIFPDGNGLGIKWTPADIRQFAEFLYIKNIKLIVCSNEVYKYYGKNIFTIKPDYDLIFYLIKNARGILSSEVDYIFVSLLISEAIIFSNRLYDEYSLFENLRFLKMKKKYFQKENIKPLDCYEYMCVNNDGNL